MNPHDTPASGRGLTQEYVLSRLSYDPDTGALKWCAGQRCGTIAGTRNENGARQVSLGGVLYLEHRLIWFMEASAAYLAAKRAYHPGHEGAAC